jgi:hypothetical protein
MSATNGSSTPKPANPPTSTLEEANEQGYLGQPPDPEPNESYTLEGVIASAAKSESKSSSSSSSSASSSSKASSSKKDSAS